MRLLGIMPYAIRLAKMKSYAAPFPCHCHNLVQPVLRYPFLYLSRSGCRKASTRLRSRINGATGNVLEEFPTRLLLWLLWLHPHSATEGADLLLKAGNDADGYVFLLYAQTVGLADHGHSAEEFGMPIVLLQARCEMGILFFLKQVIVVTRDRSLLHLVVESVIADATEEFADLVLPFGNELDVLGLLVLEDADVVLLLAKSTLQVGDAGS